MPSREVARERAYVHRLYERLDSLRDSVQRELEAVRATNPGGSHQGRTERDAFARIYEDRIAQLREVDERLAFGRLELQPVDGKPVYHYIGRIGLRDEDQRPLLLDWRVPQASAFYQATAATPLGARARRHLHTRGRDVVAIDDEVFDESLLTTEEASGLQGEAALLAALRAERTGRMHDIVATIQAEQDRIIRSELHGALVVQGGPGTGKTAVALHRAAYLLYSHRERLASAGVLIVGPSRSFVEYIEAVLPSLGETGVVTASLGTLFPGVEATEDDAPEVAELKGSIEMSRLLQRAVKSRQIVPTEDQVVEIDGERIVVPASLVRSAMERAWETHRPHNVARVTFNKTAIVAIAELLAAELRKRGRVIDEADLGLLREDVRTAHDVKVALNTAWMPLTPQKLVQDLYARPNWLASLTPRWSPEKRALLARERGAPFTVSDVPLLDEAAELLGDIPPVDAGARERERQRKRDLENAQAAIREMGVEGLVDARQLAESFAESPVRATAAELAVTDRTWTFGHIVVDEAQELSPMQWRLLVRKNPLKSFTIVGDVAQTSSAAGTRSWADALDPVFKDSWRLEELTVNYRTPAQITAVAESMAAAAGVPITPTRAVREGDWPVEIDRVDAAGGPGALAEGALAAVARVRAALEGGTIAVIAAPGTADAIEPLLAESLREDVARGARGLRRPVALLTPRDAKGLEFDAVVIVEPAEIADEGPRGAGALYVSMTRPTQRLVLVAARELPAGIEQPMRAPGRQARP